MNSLTLSYFSILGAHYVIDTINDLPGVVEKINERLAMGLGPACWITKNKGEKQIDDVFLSFTFCLLNLIALKLLTLWKLYFSAINKHFGQKQHWIHWRILFATFSTSLIVKIKKTSVFKMMVGEQLGSISPYSFPPWIVWITALIQFIRQKN